MIYDISYIIYHISYIIYHISYIIYHISYIIYHINIFLYIINITNLKLSSYKGRYIEVTYRILASQGRLQCKQALSDPREELTDLVESN